MKNLKKLLAVVLAVCMVFSIAAVGASAAFPDTATSNYKEAIDVLSGIGVINGTDQGTFDPAGGLTREQGAKIIAYLLLGPTNAGLISTATAQKFSDVPASRWSAGYIEYCANLGIIVGAGDGTFDPAGKLTTAAFTKMLLCAVGYNASAEGIGGNSWAITTATLAFAAGIYDSTISISATTPCTREQAAQLAYKALTATMVQYTGGTSVTVGGTTITTGATRSAVPNTATRYIDTDATYTTNGTMQFVEKTFPSVKKVASATSDAYGRPAYTWMNGATPIGTYANVKPVASWTVDHTYTALDTTVATALANYAFTGTETVYTNGVPTTPSITTSADIAAMTGNGKLVEVYADDSNVVTRVVIVNTVVATITAKDVDAKTVTVSDGTNSVTLSALSSTVTFGGAYAALYAKNVNDEVLLVEQASGAAITKILSFATPTYATGMYTANAAGKLTVGGTAYSVSKYSIASLTLGNTYTVTLDTYGYIINAGAPSTANTTYAFMVQGVKEGNALSGYTYSAQLIFADGTTKWVKIASLGGLSDSTSLDSAVALANKFVSYTATADSYALIDLSGSTESANAQTITKNSPTFNSKTVSTKTVFLINTGTTTAPVYTAYTGIKNVPTTISGTGYGLVSSGTYTFVIVKAVTPAAGTDVVYIYNSTPASTTYVNPSLTTNTYNALVNGVKTTIVAKNGEFPTQGMYMGNTYTGTTVTTDGSDSSSTITLNSSDSFGLGDAYTVFKYAATAQNVTLSNGVLTAINGSGSIVGVADDSFVCYTVDLSDGTCTAKTLSATAYALTGTMYFSINASGYVAYAIMVVA